MPYFLKLGNKFKITSKEALLIHERLPTSTYTVVVDCDGSFLLQQIESFEVKGKLYGSTTRHADRILRTFLDRPASTGVLLAGEKGSGKTLLTKYLAIEAAKMDIPTIVINNRELCGEKFNTFLQSIEQPTIVLLDEFEKVYQHPQQQEAMLTLLDGVYPSKKLFLLTCNDKNKVNTNMKNRPGRIFYLLDFSGLDPKFIEEYCQDNLNNKEHIASICSIASLFEQFNFDMLKAMVEEMNRYGESPSEVLKFLNARPEFNRSKRYMMQMSCQKTGRVLVKQKEWNGQPLLNTIHLNYQEDNPGALASKNGVSGRIIHKTAEFTARDLEQMNATKGTFTFVNQEAMELKLKEVKMGLLINYDRLGAVGSSSSMKHALAPRTAALSDDDDEDAQEPSMNTGGMMSIDDCCGDY